MASLQDIRRRIKSVKSIQQITNAMNMVATSRLRKAKEAAVANKPYADKMAQVVSDIAANAGDFTHPLLEARQEGKKLILVMASDKGLAGAYASNAFKEAVAGIEDKSNTEIVAVGRKTDAFFKNRDYEVAKSYIGISERPSYDNAKEIAVDLISRFVSGEVKEISMVYTRFVSAISCVPETVQLLPFGNLAGQGGTHAEYIYEPDAQSVLGYMLPQYLVTTIYAALLQAAASELSSRMNAMSNATDNAQELIAKLDLHYNKVRQAGITREITEIVGGAEALK
ncbi:MAG: ATP synthase F1 subunit gamma [Veillonellaceae bacterium]|uniref:ATP synthase F1 subunit gamma n=1 Tax=Anaerovibrio lipolyticus TaxID=82374 RepID=UPI001F160773|nr:ATP synthase F1 subunit gamma [Anaerovibrio lipolyticus]MCI6910100.1 ATP synthase F1 subunit gamma [Veillonellaceae bacterium]MDY5053216.1 ATP synthase F1 subunit gamma [Anaerovibrio sp.]MCF2600591.1 ATP synthase F1 subunit gamma [Anaerovibrio lipolyticus]MCI7078830.1 ATP synthase F1 subunit gamma [Veillonellaceae bacterium]MCI7090464.1 ATP synthase F1 subunit gamma [Veillonellaceae bacterium]